MTLAEIEDAAFRKWYPPHTLHNGIDSREDLAIASGVLRQREMLLAYAKRKANGEFPSGPEVRS